MFLKPLSSYLNVYGITLFNSFENDMVGAYTGMDRRASKASELVPIGSSGCPLDVQNMAARIRFTSIFGDHECH